MSKTFASTLDTRPSQAVEAMLHRHNARDRFAANAYRLMAVLALVVVSLSVGAMVAWTVTR